MRLLLAQGRVEVDGARASDMGQRIDAFSHVRVDGTVTQARQRRYLMLNKPAGVVSATVDARHRTVVDLLAQDYRAELHIVGRLDFNSTGLMLLSNDGAWSQRLSQPDRKLLKRYRVRVERPLSETHVRAFAQGIHFAYENITTRPARLTILDAHTAEVGLVEGRYHQIKRMFGRFDNRVLSIHRVAVGPLQLDADLPPGHSRELTLTELTAVAAEQADQAPLTA
ncbi:MAG TPA: 16S rRNA pseudouridine(516) synthase [Pseudomonadales bacterium]|nr:16S rRNA pseudouridine(516) synthase [Pseudomonadales bacterium]